VQVDLTVISSLSTLAVSGGLLLWIINNQLKYARQLAGLEAQMKILIRLFSRLEEVTEAKMIAQACHRRLDGFEKNFPSQH